MRVCFTPEHVEDCARSILLMSERTRRISLAVVALLFAILAVTNGGHGVDIRSAVASGCFLLCAVMPWWPWPWQKRASKS